MVGKALALFLGRLDGTEKGAALLRDFVRAGVQALKLVVKRLAPFVQLLQLRLGGFAAVGPGLGLGVDGGQALAAFFGGPHQGIVAALAFYLMRAAPSQFGAQAGNFVSCPGRVGYFVQGLAGFAFFGFQVFLVALDGRRLIVQGDEKRNMAGQMVLDFGHPVAGLAIGPVSHGRRFTGGAFGCPGVVLGLLRRRLTVFGDFRRRFGLGQLFASFLQALALLQPGLGGGGGGSGDGEPIPAPQRPVAADQTLTLGQVGGQTAGFVLAVDDADLRQPAFKGGGGLDEIAQRRGAAGERRRV